MNVIKSSWDYVSSALDLNQATLSGAIDVIAVKYPDGSIQCTPFHIRFGKLKLLKSREKVVCIRVNGQLIDGLKMKLGAAGEAFFVHKTIDPVEEDYSTSPLASPFTDSFGRDEIELMEPLELNGTLLAAQNISKSGDVKLDIEPEWHDKYRVVVEDLPATPTGSDLEANTGHEKDSMMHNAETVGSLTNEEVQMLAEGRDDGWSWDWGGLPVRRRPNSPSAPLRPPKVEIPGLERELSSGSQSRRQEDSRPEHSSRPMRSHMSNNAIAMASRQAGGSFTDQARVPSLYFDAWEDEEMHRRHSHDSAARGTEESGHSSPIGLDLGETGSQRATPNPTPTGARKDEVGNELFTALSRIEERFSEDESLSPPIHSQMRSPKKRTLSLNQARQSPKAADDSQGAQQNMEDDRALPIPQNDEKLNGHMKQGEAIHEKENDNLRRTISAPPGAPAAGGILNSTKPVMSLCAHLITSARSEEEAENIFRSNIVSYADFVADCNRILSDPNLLFMIYGRLFPWSVAAPYIVSSLLYDKPIEAYVLDALLRELEQPQTPAKTSWWPGWLRRRRSDISSTNISSPLAMDSVSTPRAMLNGSGLPENKSERSNSLPDDFGTSRGLDPSVLSPQSSEGVQLELRINRQPSSLGEYEGDEDDLDYYTKSLRPTLQQLLSMNLHEGQNTIEFVATSRIQGERVVAGSVFLLSLNTKLVISDVDGTLRKADKLGSIIPIGGRDWSHPGVVQLYNNISRNGYQIIYLTSRAIGQTHMTREYIKNLVQDNIALPQGPVLCSPDRLFSALTGESNPDEFKRAAMTNIRLLFPKDENPFHAGFCTTSSDFSIYQNEGIPKGKTFIVGESGQVHNLNLTYQKSYGMLNELVDAMFPPLHPQRAEVAPDEAYNEHNFWKVPLPAVDF